MNLNLICLFQPDPLTCTSLCSCFVVSSQDLMTTIKNPLSSSCFVLPCCALCYFSTKYGKSSREIHSVGKTPLPMHNRME